MSNQKAKQEFTIPGPEIVEGDTKTPYLSKELITSGKIQNVITVRLYTQKSSFLVDILKQTDVHRVVTSDTYRRALETTGSTDVGSLVENAKVDLELRKEILLEYIKNPKLEVIDDNICIDGEEVPQDTIDLLIEGYNYINNKVVREAVDRFQRDDE